MSLIEERQQEIIEEFSMYDDWMDKYSLIIESAKKLEPLAESARIEDNLIKGCQSKVWLTAGNDGEKVHFIADSDAIITKGLIALLVSVLSDTSAEEIVQADLHFINDIGLHEHLSPTRSNGLASMVKQMKLYALALSAKK
jgi:cysteine desulfuration protein SufE